MATYDEISTKIDSPGTYFVTGQAGTGKTFLVKNKILNNSLYGMLTATTGIAGINLGGITIHSMLGYFDSHDMYEKYTSGKLYSNLVEVMEYGYENIVIDEISTLPAMQLDVIFNLVETYSTKVREVGLILVGDLLQLPAVGEPSVYKAESWKYFESLELTEIKRQSDKKFIELLGLVRLGDSKNALPLVRDNLYDSIDNNFIGTTLFATNKEVDKFNAQRLALLHSDTVSYPILRTGRQRAEWSNLGTEITLKEGCIVMLLSNSYERTTDNKKLEYSNGDLAICKALGANSIIVELLRDNSRHVINRISRVNQVMKSGNLVTIGTVSYIPVRVAYASTINKSQGLTLDHVQVSISNKFLAKNTGSVYVAMSRCKKLENLRLIGTEQQFLSHVRPDHEYLKALSV